MKKSRVHSRSLSLITSRKIVAHEHLNSNGTLFGGYLVCWIDEVAFMCARRYTGNLFCVTVNIDNLTFKTPLRLGDHLLLSACVNNVGRTSMFIEVQVAKEDPFTHECTPTNTAHLTFVCLDKEQTPLPVPQLILETEEDFRKNGEAQLRSKVRKRLSRFLERKVSLERPNENMELRPERSAQANHADLS